MTYKKSVLCDTELSTKITRKRWIHSHENRATETSTRETRQQIHPLLRYDHTFLMEGFNLSSWNIWGRNHRASRTQKSRHTQRRSVLSREDHSCSYVSCMVLSMPSWSEGVKLDILRKTCFENWRFRYTKILVFDDWHSCPQWPRLQRKTHGSESVWITWIPYIVTVMSCFSSSRPLNLDKTIHTCGSFVSTQVVTFYRYDSVYRRSRQNNDNTKEWYCSQTPESQK